MESVVAGSSPALFQIGKDSSIGRARIVLVLLIPLSNFFESVKADLYGFDTLIITDLFYFISKERENHHDNNESKSKKGLN